MLKLVSILFGASALIYCAAATAGVVAESKGDGQRLLLYSDPGKICTKNTLRVQYIDKNGTVEGCWKAIPNSGNLQMVFTDGDVLVLPMDIFKKPEEV